MYRVSGSSQNHREVRLPSEDSARFVRVVVLPIRVATRSMTILAAHDVQGSGIATSWRFRLCSSGGRVISSWFSSSFTAAVIAMRRFSHAW